MPAKTLADAARDIARRSPGIDPRQAWLDAMAENPDLAALHHAGAVDETPVPVTTTVDPGAVLLTEIGRRVRAGASHADAKRATFAAMPAAVRAWNRGELVDVTPPQQPSARPVATYPERRNVANGVDPYHAAGRFHVATLRRLAPGEQRRPGQVGVEKFGTAAEGGGSFVVEAA